MTPPNSVAIGPAPTAELLALISIAAQEKQEEVENITVEDLPVKLSISEGIRKVDTYIREVTLHSPR